jgi:hypothetical protein
MVTPGRLVPGGGDVAVEGSGGISVVLWGRRVVVPI